MNGRRTFGAPRAFPGSAHRQARSPADLRQDWLRAIDLAAAAGRDAQAMAEGAQAAPSGQPGQVFSRLVAALRDLAPENFPAPKSGLSFAHRIQASAFLMAARGFTEPVGNAPEARGQLAGFLTLMAGHMDTVMDELRRAESGSWRRSTGERDE